MKYSKLIYAFIAVALSGTTVFAAEIAPGQYVMKSDGMEMQIDIMGLPDGKYAVNGNGQSASGARCRMGDLASFAGGVMQIGVCSIPFNQTPDGFELQASPPCVQCLPGASIQGKYIKK